MGMGHHAAFNTHQHILGSLYGTTPKYMQWPEYPPMIALAVGNTSISYTPTTGIKSGPDVLKACFGDDLGLTSELFNDPFRTERVLILFSLYEIHAALQGALRWVVTLPALIPSNQSIKLFILKTWSFSL